MKNKKSLAAVTFVSVALISSLWGQSEWRLRQLVQPLSHQNAPRISLAARAAWPQQNKRLALLWLSRQQRDVSPQLLVLLKSSQHPDIQLRSIRALGRLENPKMLRPLLAWQKKLTAQEQEVLYPTLPLALGRLQSHNLKGQKKLDAMAKSVGLSWNEVVRLSQKVNAPRSHAQGTPGDQIVDEVVDVLYTMGKSRERVEPLANHLTLSPAQKVYLRGSVQNAVGEAKLILDYCDSLEVVSAKDEWLGENYLNSLGPVARQHLFAHLQDMLAHPDKYPDKSGYGTIYVVPFRAAALTGEKRFLPLLTQFTRKFQPAFQQNTNSSGGWAYTFAEQSRQVLMLQEQPLFP